MSVERKTKPQLIDEVEQLRQRLAQFEQLEIQHKRDEEALRILGSVKENFDIPV